MQELRSREEELTRAALQQKSQEELLKRREQQLAEREIDVLERELNILIFQLNRDKPNVKKRKGKFKRSRLKPKDGNRISLPSGEEPGAPRGPRGASLCPADGSFSLQTSSIRSPFRPLPPRTRGGASTAPARPLPAAPRSSPG